MLELGKRGSAGVDEDAMPVLSHDVVVATLYPSDTGTRAVVAGREWLFGPTRVATWGRLAADPPDTTRVVVHGIHGKKWWARAARFQLEGTTLEMEARRWWRPGMAFTVDGRAVGRSGLRWGLQLRPTLTVGAELPLDHQVFVLWTLWNIHQESGS